MQYAEIRTELNKNGIFAPTQYFQNSPKDGGYTCAIIEVEYKGKKYRGIGFSKFNPNDFECPDTPYVSAKGKLIAAGHAEINIAEQIAMAVELADPKVLSALDSLADTWRRFTNLFAAIPGSSEKGMGKT